MNDLRLWQLLREPAPDAGAALPMLRALAALPLTNRFPFLGVLDPALTHPRADVRAAAVAVLAGAAGVVALRQLVRALHDPEGAVRLAAVEALRASCAATPDDGGRFAHALFHPDPAVRRQAVAADRPFPLPPSAKLFLLADPECRPLLEAEFAADPDPHRGRFDAAALPVLTEFVARKILPTALVRRLVLQINPADLGEPAHLFGVPLDTLGDGAKDAEALAAALAADGPPAAADDLPPCPLADLLALFWDADPGEPADSRPAFFRQLVRWAFSDPIRYRMARYLLLVAAARGTWPAPAAGVLATVHPPALACPWIPLAVRRAAVPAVNEHFTHTPHLTQEAVRRLLQSDACRRDDGHLDLRAVGTLHRLLRTEAFPHLKDVLGLPELRAAAAVQPEALIDFFAEPADAVVGRKALALALFRGKPDLPPEGVALLAWALPAGKYHELPTFTGPSAVPVFAAVRRTEAFRGYTYSESQLAGLTDRFAGVIDGRRVGDFLAAWLVPVGEYPSVIGRAVFLRLCQAKGAAVLAAVGALPEEPRRRFDAVVAKGCADWLWRYTPQLAKVFVPAPPSPGTAVPGLSAPREPTDHQLQALKKSRDIPHLAGVFDGPSGTFASTAARRLCTAGKEGLAALLARLPGPATHPHLKAAMEAVSGSLSGDAETRLLALAENPAATPETRFRAGLVIRNRSVKRLPDLLADLLLEPGPVGWLTSADYDALGRLWAGRSKALALKLAASPHPAAHEMAVRLLFTEKHRTADVLAALEAFLALGPAVRSELRAQAAAALADAGRKSLVLPVLLQAPPANPPAYPALLVGLSSAEATAVVTATLALGSPAAEWQLFTWLEQKDVPPAVRDHGFAELLADAGALQLRRQVRSRLGASISKGWKLARLADTFAWGVRVGEHLLGERFRVVMLVGSKLGYTRFTEKRVYVTGLPIVRDEPDADEVVQGLILHEFGHHLYHKAGGGAEVWAKADAEGMGKLLNLVADEHLERNLRRKSAAYGDRLKTLNAYAFQHADREVHGLGLAQSLGAAAFPVLTAVPLAAARAPGCVTVGSGRLLRALERQGSSFARFMRALRMGLGDRTGDPKVAAGLALFGTKAFADCAMPELMAKAHQLRAIFGRECDLLNYTDPHEVMEGGEGDWLCDGDGITDADIQKRVEGLLRGEPHPGAASVNPGGTLWTNAGPDEEFDRITTVVKVPHDPAAHAAYAGRVRRPARELRRFFDHLGLGRRAERLRVRGRQFDKTRATAVVVRGDPRMLIAREPQRMTDLFIGVVVDCSGSMSGSSMEKARLFATLLAEAVKGQAGIDLRMFGFTDQVIYDAGTAARCGAGSLVATGGNNDAAGLWHAYLAARGSKRRAKLLVMISDGAPTECTVAALRGLVARLTRRGYCCAQAAVRPVGHDCFPNYVLLEEDRLDDSVRKFGQVVMRLVGKAMGTG